MNTKNLFLTKFYDFLLKEKDFFTNYKKVYVINFLQLLKKNYPQFKIEKEIKNTVSNFFESLFISPALKNGNFKPLIEMKELLQEYRIDKSILNKTFLLMANNYIKHIFPSSNIEKFKIFSLLIDFYIKFFNSHIIELEKNYYNLKFPEFIVKIYKQKSPIVLFGVYKGIPISNKSNIISINENTNTIKVKANSYQLIASKFQKEIYILDIDSNKTFKAFVKDIVFYESALILSDIKEIKRESLKRNYIRVQPKEKIPVSIALDQKKYFGYMYDLSIKGISVITQKNIPLNINETAEISFKLLIDRETTFKFTAELRSISHYDNNYRYHFYFEPTPSEEEKLEKYITNREKEIISELTNYLNKEFIDI